MSEERIKVLYVDDEVNNLTAFKATFRRDFKIYLAENAMEGLKLLKEHKIEIVLSDQRMPNLTGVEFFEMMREKYPEPMRMLITAYADIEAVVDAINRGQVYRYITKPWDPSDLKLTILQALEVYKLRVENKVLMEELQVANKQLEFIARQKLLS
jgi:response regulator RpfG family c-di-GMP phosphodiesterase